MRSIRSFCIIALAFLGLLPMGAFARSFDLKRDTFAFANDTVFAYGVDEAGKLHISRREKPPTFSHGCFLLCRGAMQFWKFAEFDPKAPKLSREEYRVRVRQIFRIPVWSHGPEQRVVIPGFSDLHDFSKAYEGLLKENLGNWFMTYLRVGNWRMMMGHPRFGQALAARWLIDSLKQGEPRVIYMSRFPWMNHAVIVYRAEPLPGGAIRFQVYDSNYPGVPAHVEYTPADQSFSFEKRWYFPGGRVNVMRTYISPFQ